jgi:hypothetical protein
MRYSALAIVVLLAACTDATTITEPPEPSTTILPTTATAAVTTTTTTSTQPPTTTTTTTAPVAEPVAADGSPFIALPLPDEDWPHTFADVVIGNDGLLYVGDVSPTPRDHPNESALWHYDGATWQRTLVSDLLPQGETPGFAQTTNFVVWKGEYVGFLTHFSGEDGVPLLMTSADGRNWEVEDLTSGGAGSFGSIHPTPESPPWPGAIGVSFLTTTATEIVAVGWVSTDQGSAPTLWRSTDARTWDVTLLPNGGSDREWASRVAVGDAGWLVAANGPYHSTNLLWFSPTGEEWTQVGNAFLEEDQWWSIADFAAGDSALVAETTDFVGETTVTQMWRSTNGTDWAKAGEPIETTGSVERLAAIGSSLFRLTRTAETVTLESSPDGGTWTTRSTFEPPQDPWGDYFRLGSTGDEVMLTRFDNSEDFMDPAVSVWFDSPVMDVVLVEADDALNVRDGVLAEVIGELDPNATGVQTTGRTDGAAGSLWAEIVHNGRLGWVNSLYLAETVEDVTADQLETVAEEFAQAVFRDGGPIGPHVGRKGLSVVHFDQTKWWTRNDDPMADATVYYWGSTGCGTDPECAPQATFAEMIAGGFLSAWDDDDRVIEVDTPIGSGNQTLPEFVIPTPFRGFHYLTVFDPGDDPQYEGMDWLTYYLYFDIVDGEPLVVGLSVDMWAP